MASLEQDLHYSARRLGKARWFSITVILMLVFGIGATTRSFLSSKEFCFDRYHSTIHPAWSNWATTSATIPASEQPRVTFEPMLRRVVHFHRWEDFEAQRLSWPAAWFQIVFRARV